MEATLGASHTVRFASPASSAATVTLKGGSSVTLQIAGDLPTGLRFHYAGRASCLTIFVR